MNYANVIEFPITPDVKELAGIPGIPDDARLFAAHRIRRLAANACYLGKKGLKLPTLTGLGYAVEAALLAEDSERRIPVGEVARYLSKGWTQSLVVDADAFDISIWLHLKIKACLAFYNVESIWVEISHEETEFQQQTARANQAKVGGKVPK